MNFRIIPLVILFFAFPYFAVAEDTAREACDVPVHDGANLLQASDMTRIQEAMGRLKANGIQEVYVRTNKDLRTFIDTEAFVKNLGCQNYYDPRGNLKPDLVILFITFASDANSIPSVFTGSAAASKVGGNRGIRQIQQWMYESLLGGDSPESYANAIISGLHVTAGKYESPPKWLAWVAGFLIVFLVITFGACVYAYRR